MAVQGEWGGLSAIAWAPRPSILLHSFPLTPRATDELATGGGAATHSAQAAAKETRPLQAARLAASWNGQISIFVVPYAVALPPRAHARSSSVSGGAAAGTANVSGASASIDPPAASGTDHTAPVDAGRQLPPPLARRASADGANLHAGAAAAAAAAPAHPPRPHAPRPSVAEAASTSSGGDQNMYLQPQLLRSIALPEGEVVAKLGWVADGHSAPEARSGDEAASAGPYRLLALAVPALTGEDAATGSREGALTPWLYGK